MDEQYIQQETISIEEIKQSDKTEGNAELLNFKLSDGKSVEMDLAKANGRMLMNARMMQEKTQGISLSVFILSLLCKFNGQKYSPDEILDLNLDDVLLLEMAYQTKKKPQTD